MDSKKDKQQIWGSRLAASPDELNVEFCAGRDVKPLPMADEVLLKYDIWTNLAHSAMLNKSGIINDQEVAELKQGLLEIFEKVEAGTFQLDPSKEDVHINIEHYLTYTKGISAGEKIHSGRSRNDQISTDIRLFLRDQVVLTIKNLLVLIDVLLKKAAAEKNSIMPGFTHYQPAMITTAGHWISNWSQALLRDCQRFLNNYGEVNTSPLGSAASFGTSWPIDREYSATLLGFDSVDENSLDAISSRGEYEAAIASSMSIMMNHLSTLSQDLILLSTPYYDMLTIDDRFVTGSSIMPQKRNPDFAEVVRSKAASCHGSLMSLLGTLKGSMSGYNRDSQQTKYLVMDLFRECLPVPLILSGVCESMVFKRESMENRSRIGFMNAADVADWLAQRFSLPFRKCYEVLSLAVKYSDQEGQLTYDALDRSLKELEVPASITQEEVTFLNTPSSLIDQKKHTGGPAPVSVEKMIEKQRTLWKAITQKIKSAEDKLEAARRKCFE